MSIEPGQTQYARYRNGFLQAQCKSAHSVLVTWSTGFAQPMTAETWEQALFVEQPHGLIFLEGDQAQQAQAFFQQKAR